LILPCHPDQPGAKLNRSNFGCYDKECCLNRMR
jgi:hypothetical protein